MKTLLNNYQRHPFNQDSELSPKRKSLPRTELSNQRRLAKLRRQEQIQKTQPAQLYQLNSPSYKIKTPHRLHQNLILTARPTPTKRNSPSRLPHFYSEAAFASDKYLKTQFPSSPMSIRQMTQMKQKMKLETEAKEVFLRLVSEERIQSPALSSQKTRSIREHLKTEFQRGFGLQYEDYFSHKERKLTIKPKRIGQERKIDFRFLKGIQQTKQRDPVLITLQSNVFEREMLNIEQPDSPPEDDLQLQSQVRSKEDTFRSNVQRQEIDYLPQVASIISKQITNRNLQESLRRSNIDIVISSPPLKNDFIESYGLDNPIDRQSFHKSVSFQPHSMVSVSEASRSQRNSQVNSLRSNFNKRSYSSKLSETEEEPQTVDKIDEYLRILDMFVTNICEFDELITEPNSISGIVNFYLYKRFLREKKRLQRCLSGGSNIFENMDYYEVTDRQLKEYTQQPEGQELVKQIQLQNLDAQKKLKTVLDFLRKELGKDFPKADVDTEESFEIELRYYLRMEVEQIKNKLDLSTQNPKALRLKQRLVFLYQATFLITFFNGQFVKNYEFYQEVPDLKSYILEHQQLFETYISNSPK